MRKSVGTIAVWVLLTGGAAAQYQGRVIMSGAERSDVLVKLVNQNGQILDQAFTGTRGTFLFEGVSAAGLRADNPLYVVIDEEGYKPYRERIYQSDLRGGGMTFAIYLEPEDASPAVGGAAAGTVDVRQLQVQIPEAAVEAYERAREAAEDGDHEEAARHLELAVGLAPDYYDAWIDLGAGYARLGRHDAAKEAYLKAVEANPGGALAQLNVGVLYYQQGDRERAEGNAGAPGTFSLAREWLEKSVQLDPTSPAARFYLGATLYRLAVYDESEEWLEQAITMDGGYAASARSMLINVYTRQNRYLAALEQTAIFLENHPDAPERESIERVRLQLEAALGR